ncbi:MAG: ATP-binding protein [Candidatus Eisenbacteria bacterium]
MARKMGTEEPRTGGSGRNTGRPSFGLPRKWMLLQGGALLALALATAGLIQRGESLKAEREATARGRSLAELLAQAAGPNVTFDDSSRLLRILEGATRVGDLASAAVLDGEGRIVAHTDVAMIGRATGLSTLGVNPSDEDPKAAREIFGGHSGRVLLHPLIGSEGFHGAVAIQLSAARSALFGPEMVRYLLPAVILMLAFVVFGQMLVRAAVRPAAEFLEKLSVTLESTGGGEGAFGESPSKPEEDLDQTVTRINALMETKDGLVIKNRLLGYEKRRMELILEGFPDGLLVTNTMKEVVYLNRQATRYLRIPEKEGDDGSGLQDSAELARLIREADKAGRSLLTAAVAGSERIIAVTRTPLTKSSGRTAGTLYMMRDVTAQEASQKAQAEFLSQVTHELKAPLNTVITFVEELAENDGLGADERKDYFNSLNAETGRMAQLISNLLQLSRIQLGNLSANFSHVKTGNLVASQADSLRRHAEGLGLSLRVNVPENLPAVLGDKDLLGVAVNNLISNAVKYTNPGGVVSIEASAAGGGVAVSVEDTGIGIPEQEHARVFERFYRSGREEVQEKGGTGLGLALVREIVEMHGGKVSLESTVGEGSRFVIWLPVREAGTRADVVEVLA